MPKATKCLLVLTLSQAQPLKAAQHAPHACTCCTGILGVGQVWRSMGPNTATCAHLMPTLSAPISLVTASTTSSTNLQRLASLPPYSSVRLLELSLMNSSSTSAAQSRGLTTRAAAGNQQAHGNTAGVDAAAARQRVASWPQNE